MDRHFDDLICEYNFTASIEGWATEDLVELSLLIDAELQQRAAEEDRSHDS